MADSENPPVEQIKFLIIGILGGIVFYFVITGSDVYIARGKFPRWLEIILNFLTFGLAFAAGISFILYFTEFFKKSK